MNILAPIPLSYFDRSHLSYPCAPYREADENTDYMVINQVNSGLP